MGNVLIGMSFGWWVPKHSAHHAHPNEVGRDPDVGGVVVQPSTDGPVKVASWPSRFMTKWQAPLFFPLMVLRSTGIYVLGIQRLVRERNRTAVLEGALLALHAALYLTVVFWFLSPLKAVAFILIQQAVFSVYLGCSFAPNHKGMPIIDPEQGLSFVRRQVVSSRNVAGGWFTNVLLGGLNFQIEHHLFPSMPRPNLSRAQDIVRTFCADNGLSYREDSLTGLVPPDDPRAASGCPCRRPTAPRHGSSRSITLWTNSVVASCPAVTPRPRSSDSTWDSPVIKSSATIGGTCSGAIPSAWSAAVSASELGGARALGVAGDLGPDGLAMVRQCDELGHEGGTTGIGVEAPQRPQRVVGGDGALEVREVLVGAAPEDLEEEVVHGAEVVVHELWLETRLRPHPS